MGRVFQVFVVVGILLGSLFGYVMYQSASASTVPEPTKMSTKVPTVAPTPTDIPTFFGKFEGLKGAIPEIKLTKLTVQEVNFFLGSGNVSFDNVPVSVGAFVRPPCDAGLVAVLVGYKFVWNTEMSWREHKSNGYHPGVDVQCKDPKDLSGNGDGNPIRSVLPGVVQQSRYITTSENDAVTTWISGNSCTVLSNINGHEILTVYGHLKDPIEGNPYDCPQPGTVVTYDTYLGRQGSTGRSTGTHLHFGIAIKREGDWFWVDPEQLGLLNSVRLENSAYQVYGGPLCDIPRAKLVQLSREVGSKVALEQGIQPQEFLPNFLALIYSESSFRMCYEDGRLLINGSDARGLGQVINHWHPECDKDLLARDPEYNLTCSANIYISYYRLMGNNWERGASKYKGESGILGGLGHEGWLTAFNRGYFEWNGEKISLR